MQNPFLPGISRSGFQVVMEPLYLYNVYNTDDVRTAWTRLQRR